MLIRFSRLQIFAGLFAMLFFTACNSAPETPEEISITPTQSTRSTAVPQDDTFPDIPPEARIATRAGDPRPVAYWVLWNACAEENRAELAAANGGRAAGWFLMDDLLADPGIQLGDYPVTTCEAGLALLQEHTIAGEETTDPIYGLAAKLLAADLNLNVGAESCPIAEEAVAGGHLILAQVGFDGDGEYVGVTTTEIANAIPRIVELLSAYNRGELCR